MKQGVRVNAVAPGGIANPMTTENPLAGLGDKVDNSLYQHLNRPDQILGTAEQVAGVVAMLLASDDGGFMTGEIVKIDGGVHN